MLLETEIIKLRELNQFIIIIKNHVRTSHDWYEFAFGMLL